MALVATFCGGWTASELNRRWKQGSPNADRPSLSNTAYFIQALRAADNAKTDSDPALERALKFMINVSEQNVDTSK